MRAGIAALAQLSGIGMMICYAPTILKEGGFGAGATLLSAMGITAVYLAMTSVGLALWAGSAGAGCRWR